MNHDQLQSQSSKPRSHKGCRCSQRDTSCLTGTRRSTHGSPAAPLTRSERGTQGPTARTHCSGGAGPGEQMDTGRVDRAPTVTFCPHRIPDHIQRKDTPTDAQQPTTVTTEDATLQQGQPMDTPDRRPIRCPPAASLTRSRQGTQGQTAKARRNNYEGSGEPMDTI